MSSSAWYRELVSGRSRGLAAGLFRAALGLAEVGYGAVVRSKNRRYDTGRAAVQRVDAPVISVGNLTVGGTGKTPLVCWLAGWLLEQGVRVTLISRGYGAKAGHPNDEALELAARLPGVPHLQNADRVAAARAALSADSERGTAVAVQDPAVDELKPHDPLAPHVLLLDDAFQHRRIARDLDIVLLDALQPFGFDHLLPRGLLREPPENLARAHVVALSRADAISRAVRDQIRQRVARLAPQALWVELIQRPAGVLSSTGQRRDLTFLRSGKVAAFCGIGNPEGFRHSLSACGVNIAELREFPDHFAYPPAALDELSRWALQHRDCAAAVCTHKDLVKIPRDALGPLPLWALVMDLEISAGKREFESLLREIIDGAA